MSYVNHPEPLTLNQAADAAGLSRSTIKRRLKALEKAGAYRLPSGEWRIPPAALDVLVDGVRGSTIDPREPGPDEPREPRREPFDPPFDEPDEPREPPQAKTLTDELADARRALVEARLEAAEWRARAEERSARITELVTRAEAAEARLDRMITSQTALALTLKEQQQITAAAPAPPAAETPPPPAAAPAPEPDRSTPAAATPGAAAPEVREESAVSVPEPNPTIGERFRTWRASWWTR